MCFNLIEFDRVLKMNLDIALIVKDNAKIFFIKEIKHFAYAPTELLAKSVFTHRARKVIWNIGINISYPKMHPPLVNNKTAWKYPYGCLAGTKPAVDIL